MAQLTNDIDIDISLNILNTILREQKNLIYILILQDLRAK